MTEKEMVVELVEYTIHKAIVDGVEAMTASYSPETEMVTITIQGEKGQQVIELDYDHTEVLSDLLTQLVMSKIG